MKQLDIFGELYDKPKTDKKLAVLTLFSGYDSQALSLKYLGVDYVHHRTCEWAIKSIQALKDIHFSDDNTDYSKDKGIIEIINFLYDKGISQDYNKPMTLKQIQRLSEKQLRTIYNNIIATHNMVNIQKVKWEDLGIDNSNYAYVMSYSFPC